MKWYTTVYDEDDADYDGRSNQRHPEETTIFVFGDDKILISALDQNFLDFLKWVNPLWDWQTGRG